MKPPPPPTTTTTRRTRTRSTTTTSDRFHFPPQWLENWFLLISMFAHEIEPPAPDPRSQNVRFFHAFNLRMPSWRARQLLRRPVMFSDFLLSGDWAWQPSRLSVTLLGGYFSKIVGLFRDDPQWQLKLCKRGNNQTTSFDWSFMHSPLSTDQ